MESAIYAFALLKATWERRHATYLDNFLPLVLDRLKLLEGDTTSAPSLRQLIRDEYGLVLPLKVVHNLLVRAAKRKYVRLEYGVYYIEKERLADVDLTSLRRLARERYDQLTLNLAKFASSQFNLSWSQEESDKILGVFLSDFGHRVLGALYGIDRVKLPKRKSAEGRYVLATWVNHILATGGSLFDSLKTVAEGNLLIGGLFMPQGAQAAKRFTNTTIYLDSKPLLEYLGYAGDSLQKPQEELIQLLRLANARVACFEHTADEIKSILRGAGYGLSPSSTFAGYGPVYQHFRTMGASEVDALLYAETLEKTLRGKNIEIVPKPPYDPSLLINEQDLERVIREAINYFNENALRRDVDSVSAIVRLRNGIHMKTLESSVALFCSSNRELVKATLDWQQESSEDVLLTSVGLIILDRDLTSIMWLKQPSLAPDLPRRRLVADFYAAIQPSEEFMRRYLEEVDNARKHKGLTDEEVLLLRHSLEARQLAMDLTIGSEDAFVEGTVAEVLARVRDSIQAEARVALKKKEGEVDVLQAEAASLRDSALRAAGRRDTIASRAAEWLSWAVSVILALAGVFLIYAAADLADSVTGVKWLASIVVMALSALGLARDAFGLRRRMKTMFSGVIRSLLDQLAGQS